MTKRAIDIIIAALTALLLAFGLFGSGLLVCMMPQTTQLLGNNFAGWESATYPEDTMEELAEAVRSFSVDNTGRSLLESTVKDALVENHPEVEADIRFGGTGGNTSSNSSSGGLGVSNLISIYTLPQSAIDHLQDCVPVFTTSRIAIALSLVFALVGTILLIIRRQRKLAGWILFIVPLVVVCIIVALALWAFIDFDSLFAWLHSLFFTGGSWLFPANSLLITLFPEAFWMGMGIVWVGVSILASLLVCAIGSFMKR